MTSHRVHEGARVPHMNTLFASKQQCHIKQCLGYVTLLAAGRGRSANGIGSDFWSSIELLLMHRSRPLCTWLLV